MSLVVRFIAGYICKGDLMMKKMGLSAALIITLGLAVAFAATGNVAKREYVCMMQDMVLTKPGIPIQYQGKTYYGCCNMCKEKIQKEPQRYTKAIDPVSGKGVDKAEAFIYGVEGDAYYFGSEANRKAFAANPQKYLHKSSPR
jgi:YHS domain-containing protein